MSAIRLAWNNAINRATLTAGSEAAGLTAANLKSPFGSPSVAWQTAANILSTDDGAYLIIDAGVTVVNNVFAIFRSNLSPTAQVAWRVWQLETMLDGSLVYSTGWMNAGVVPGFGHHVHFVRTDVETSPNIGATDDAFGRYIRLDIYDPDNTDGFINIPLIYVGPAWAPLIGMSFQSSQNISSGGASPTTRGGQVWQTNYWRARSWNIQMDFIAESEVWSRAMELIGAAPQGINTLFAPDVDSADTNREVVFGLVNAGPLGFSFNSMDARSWSATITERL